MMKKYPDTTELHRQRKEQRKIAAKRPASEKMGIVAKLRDIEKTLAPVRAANKARRATKQIKIHTKTA